jgi:hypothetical protein
LPNSTPPRRAAKAEQLLETDETINQVVSVTLDDSEALI